MCHLLQTKQLENRLKIQWVRMILFVDRPLPPLINAVGWHHSPWHKMAVVLTYCSDWHRCQRHRCQGTYVYISMVCYYDNICLADDCLVSLVRRDHILHVNIQGVFIYVIYISGKAQQGIELRRTIFGWATGGPVSDWVRRPNFRIG